MNQTKSSEPQLWLIVRASQLGFMVWTPWATLCRSSGAEFLNEFLTRDTSPSSVRALRMAPAAARDNRLDSATAHTRAWVSSRITEALPRCLEIRRASQCHDLDHAFQPSNEVVRRSVRRNQLGHWMSPLYGSRSPRATAAGCAQNRPEKAS